MSVIGRLDEQVDAVLIKPLDTNRRPTAETRERESDEQVAAVAPAASATDEAASPPNEEAGAEDLPVWLL